MKPATNDLTIYQGSTFSKTWVLDQVTIDAGFDFSQYDLVRMQIRKKPNSDTVIWDSVTQGGLTLQDDRIILNIPAHITAEFSFKTAGYDIELVKTSVNPQIVDKFLTGTITLVKEYTK